MKYERTLSHACKTIEIRVAGALVVGFNTGHPAGANAYQAFCRGLGATDQLYDGDYDRMMIDLTLPSNAHCPVCLSLISEPHAKGCSKATQK